MNEKIRHVKGRLRMLDPFLDLVVDGKKTSTIRHGKIEVVGDALDLVSAIRTVRVQVTAVENEKMFRDLGEEDAARDGFASLDQLQRQLVKFYPEITPDDHITIIRFAVQKERR